MGNPFAQGLDSVRSLINTIVMEVNSPQVESNSASAEPKVAAKDHRKYFAAKHEQLQATLRPEKHLNREIKAQSAFFDREFWEQVGGLPKYIGRLGDALQTTHELFIEHDIYRYALLGVVILAGLNHDDASKSLPEKVTSQLRSYDSEFRGFGQKVSGKIENCTKGYWDSLFDSGDEVDDNSEGIFSFRKKKSPEWILNKKIRLNDSQYRVKVSTEGVIKVNDRTWHLKDADKSRNADITVSAIEFDPQLGLHFKVKGQVLLFSKEVSKDLSLEQTAALLSQLATAERDPTPQEIRAAGVELVPGQKHT